MYTFSCSLSVSVCVCTLFVPTIYIFKIPFLLYMHSLPPRSLITHKNARGASKLHVLDGAPSESEMSELYTTGNTWIKAKSPLSRTPSLHLFYLSHSPVVRAPGVRTTTTKFDGCRIQRQTTVELIGWDPLTSKTLLAESCTWIHNGRHQNVFGFGVRLWWMMIQCPCLVCNI